MAIRDATMFELHQTEKGSRDGSLSSRAKSCSSAAEHRAAVDVEDFAGDVARPIGAQKHDCIGYVISQRNTLQRNGLLDFVLVSVGAGPEDGIVQFGVYPAGCDAIHADVGRQLNRQRLAEADLPALRRCIVGVARLAALTRRRADDDDRATALAL